MDDSSSEEGRSTYSELGDTKDMGEVYQSVSTTNEVEDRYARNEEARKATLGPLTMIIRFLGFDLTYSLFKKETRSRWISWIATPIAVLGVGILTFNFFNKLLFGISRFLTWHWGETMILAFLAMQAFVAAVCLCMQTSKLFYLQFYDAWSNCWRLAEKEEDEKKEWNNGKGKDAETGQSGSSSTPHNTAGPVKVILALLLFGGASIASGTKFFIYVGHSGVESENSTADIFEQYKYFHPLLSFWGALVSATALCVYGTLHGIMQDTIDNFNKDLEAASNAGTLPRKLGSFSVRHQAILIFARLLSSNMGGYATYSTEAAIIANFSAMFLSIAFKGAKGPLGIICVLLWLIVVITSNVVVLLQAAAVQKKLNRTCEILVIDKQIWSGDIAVAQQAQMMITKRNTINTNVTVLKCLRLTPWVANGLMLLPPIIGGLLVCLRVFAHLKTEF